MSIISKKIWYIITQTYFKKRFRSVGKGSLIYKPIQLDNVFSVRIKESVYIAEGAWLMGSKKMTESLVIGAGTTIGHFAHIVGLHSVTIEEDVLIADRVFISDCTHSYENVSISILMHEVKNLSPVVIGEGSWLGENVCVFGASVGKHCVIGANSVVTSDIPDYSVAVGSPARVVKKYDFEMNEWIKV